MLLFFGYELYEVVTDEGKKLICISKDYFKENDKPIGIKLDEFTFIISKWKKEN